MMNNVPKLDALQESFGVILCSIIMSDKVISNKEKKKFNDFFKDEFSLSSKNIEVLFEYSMSSLNKLNLHIAQLKEGLEIYPSEKARFMQYLNGCILCDGVDDREYVTFEEIRSKLF